MVPASSPSGDAPSAPVDDASTAGALELAASWPIVIRCGFPRDVAIIPGGRRAAALPAAHAGGAADDASAASSSRWNRCSSAPGSTPSSSAMTSCACANTSSASARRPASSRARMSSSQSRSRIGCSATRPRSSATTCAARPQARSASMRNSVAVIRTPAPDRPGWRAAATAGRRRAAARATAPSASPSSGGRRPRIARGQRGPALGDPRLELLHVQVAVREAQQVPGRPVDEYPALGVTDDLAQPVHVDADEVVRGMRRVVAPDLVDQHVGRDKLARAHKQAGEQRPPLGGADRRPPLRGQHFKRTKDAEPHQVGLSERTRSSGLQLDVGPHSITTQPNRKSDTS